MVGDVQCLKIFLIGNNNVGKTSLLNKYLKGVFTYYPKHTIGVELQSKQITIGDNFVKLQLWDITGHKLFQSVFLPYYREADCCVLVYDVTDEHSFEHLNYWRDQVLVHAAPADKENFPFVLLGNKVDLSNRQVISTKEAEEWCQSNFMCPYFETTAIHGKNVDRAFQKIAEMALNGVKRTKHICLVI